MDIFLKFSENVSSKQRETCSWYGNSKIIQTSSFLIFWHFGNNPKCLEFINFNDVEYQLLCFLQEVLFYVHAFLIFLFFTFEVCRLFPLKSDSHSQKKKLFYLLQWKPFKMMKNVFHFILKALFFLKVFKFFSWIFGHVEKRLD